MAKKIIIDTDPGIDDAMAICFAFYSEAIELIGLTTIFGNVSTKQATTNALVLLEKLETSLPVAMGAEKPLKKKIREFPDFVHGKNGFGEITYSNPKLEKHPATAVDFIIDQIMSDPGNITIVAIGPLTNLALAIKKEPAILEAVEQIVVMGGAVTVNGNVNPAAEANMLSDPHAADFVLSRPGPITMVGLDVSQQIIMDISYLVNVHKGKGVVGDFLFSMSQYYLDFHRSVGVDGLFTHDPSAIAYVIDPDLFKVKYGEIRVATEGIAEGQTIMNLGNELLGESPWTGVPKNGVCLEVNTKGVLDLYKSVFSESTKSK